MERDLLSLISLSAIYGSMEAIKFAVYFSPSGDIYLGGDATDCREILHDGTYVQDVFSLWELCAQRPQKSEIWVLNFGHLTANIS